MTNYTKLRGGYYTPKPIAEFLSQWAIRSSTDTVFEPSCGDGILLKSAVTTLKTLGATSKSIIDQISGIELDPDEADKSRKNLSADLDGFEPKIHTGDFFTYCQKELLEETFFDQIIRTGKKFNAVIGNPPFIRYQNFPEEYRKIAFQIMGQIGFTPTKLSNAWLPFLVISTLLLTKNGRLAMVIPAELFQVGYAAQTREFLSQHFSKLIIVTFKELVFLNIQQEVVLLLGEHNGSQNSGIQVLEINNLNDLDKIKLNSVLRNNYKPLDHSTDKWTQYFLDKEEISLLRELRNHPGVINSGSLFQVDVGVVTGRNKYFLLNAEEVKELSIASFVEPIVSKSAHLRGAIFFESDWIKNRDLGYPSYLFFPADKPFEKQPEHVREYIQNGKKSGVPTGYKCRIRNRWYIVPSVWTPDAFMLRQIHSYPKIILNKTNATSTDTIHRVRFSNGYPPEIITVGFINSLTFAFSEVTGRSYGGGVLTFEPSETENLPIPLGNHNKKVDLALIDEYLRKDLIEKALDLTDHIFLIDGLGLSIKEVRQLRAIWSKLRNRRINRKRSVKTQ